MSIACLQSEIDTGKKWPLHSKKPKQQVCFRLHGAGAFSCGVLPFQVDLLTSTFPAHIVRQHDVHASLSMSSSSLPILCLDSSTPLNVDLESSEYPILPGIHQDYNDPAGACRDFFVHDNVMENSAFEVDGLEDITGTNHCEPI